MRRTWAVFAVVGYLASAKAETGNDIINLCGPMIRGLSGDPADIAETLQASHCAGFVAGMNDMATVLMDLFERKLYCLPREGLELGQILRVFIKWLEEHPADLHGTARTLFIQSMRDNFPCD